MLSSLDAFSLFCIEYLSLEFEAFAKLPARKKFSIFVTLLSKSSFLFELLFSVVLLLFDTTSLLHNLINPVCKMICFCDDCFIVVSISDKLQIKSINSFLVTLSAICFICSISS